MMPLAPHSSSLVSSLILFGPAQFVHIYSLDKATLIGRWVLFHWTAYKSSVKHITLAGDHQQGAPIFAASDSNVGHGVLSRNLFQEIAEDQAGQHTSVALNKSYRCVKGLLKFI